MAWSLTVRNISSLREKECGMLDAPTPPAVASWRKSNASGAPQSECVEVVTTQEHVWVRDSKNPLGPTLRFTREGWSGFLAGVQRGEFDLAGVPA